MNREQLASLLYDPAPWELAHGSPRQSVKALRDTLGPAGAVAVDPERFSISTGLDAFDVVMRHFHGLPDTAKADPAAVLQVAAL